MLVGTPFNSCGPQNINYNILKVTKHIFPAIARHEPNFGMPFFKRIFYFLHLKNILITPVVHIIKK